MGMIHTAVNFVILLFTIFRTVNCVLPDDYVGRTPKQKQGILWTQIENSPYTPAPLPTTNPTPMEQMSLFKQDFLQVVFVTNSDEVIPGRKKLAHLYGVVAKVELVIFPNSTYYTGLFHSGGIGLVRLSLAKYDIQNLVPGMAFKILIDGQKSQNFFALNTTDGQGTNQNFFFRPMSNVLDEAKHSDAAGKALEKVFTATANHLPGGTDNQPESASNIPLYEAASVDSAGTKMSSVHAPYKISYTPNPRLGWDAKSTQDFRMQLIKVPQGSVLYTVAVNRAPGAALEIIGQLVTRSPFMGSHYGDDKLFFQHPSKRWRKM